MSGGTIAQSSRMPTTRAGAALAPTIRSGKQLTWKPVAGSAGGTAEHRLDRLRSPA